jgi:hypothetical protein
MAGLPVETGLLTGAGFFASAGFLRCLITTDSSSSVGGGGEIGGMESSDVDAPPFPGIGIIPDRRSYLRQLCNARI